MYLGVVALIAVWSAIDDARAQKAAAWIVADIAALGALALLFVSHFHPPLASAIGRPAILLFALGFAWTGYATHREIMALVPDPELSPRANLVGDHLGVLLGVAVFAPLIGFAAVVAMQAW